MLLSVSFRAQKTFLESTVDCVLIQIVIFGWFVTLFT
jgi:hypothetical protein